MKKIIVAALVLIILPGLAVAGINALTDLRQAEAMKHAAKAVQLQATAGAVTTVGLTLVIVLLVAMIVALIVLVVVMGKRTARNALTPFGAQAAPALSHPREEHRGHTGEREKNGAWVSGPNARWGKRLPVGGQDRITAEELARALMIARMLDGQGGPTALPSGEVEDPEAWEGLFGL